MVWFPFCFSGVRFEKTGSAKPNCNLSANGCKGRVRVGKRFIFCRANLAVSAKKKNTSIGMCFLLLHFCYFFEFFYDFYVLGADLFTAAALYTGVCKRFILWELLFSLT